jgi:hypothetical protein
MARRLYVLFDRTYCILCDFTPYLSIHRTCLKLKSSCVPSISREFELRRNGNCVVSLCDLARQIPHTREVIGALSSDLSMATEDQPMEGALAPENERSPSPAPPPPVAAAPGPRATALQKLYGDAIAHVLKTCSYSNFASCFPTPAKQVPDSLRHLHEQFTDRLGASMRMNFDQILTERNVVPSLNELDGLIEDAKKRKTKAEEDADGQPIQTPVP